VLQFTKADLALSVYPVLAALASYNRYMGREFKLGLLEVTYFFVNNLQILFLTR
jgi:hypothetical protein